MNNQSLSDTQLRIGYWYTGHRAQLRQWTIRVLIGVNGALYLFVFGSLIADGVMGVTYRARMQEALTFNTVLALSDAANAPRGLQTQSENYGTGSTLVRVANANDAWVARVQTGTGDASVVLPGKESFVVVSSLDAAAPVTPTVTWQRLSRDELSLVPFLPAEQDFPITDSVFSVSSLPGGTFTRVSAVVKNTSPWELRDVHFTVLALQGDAIVAASPLTIARLGAGESAPFTATWTSMIGGISAVRLVPVFDVLSADHYGNPDPRLNAVMRYF